MPEEWGDKPRNPTRNQKEPGIHDGTECQKTRETSPGTVPKGQKLMMKQNARRVGRQAPEPYPEPVNHDGTKPVSWKNWEPHSAEQLFGEKISFGDIPNSSSIDILMPYAIFDYMGAFLPNGFAHVDNVIRVIKTITWLPLSRPQGNKPHRNSPEPFEPCLRNLHQHAPELFGTLRNFPNPASGTYTNTRRNSPEPSGTFQDLPEPTFRNLPEPTSGTYARIRWNPPEPSGTFRNPPPEPTLEPSGTCRNLPPEPAPAPATRTGTHRSLSGLKTPLAYAVGEKYI